MELRSRKGKRKIMNKCELEIGDRVTPTYDKERRNQIGEVVAIDIIEDFDGMDDTFGAIVWDVYFCDVKFSDGVVKCYRDCRLKKVH
jgi:hypothetical protein